MKITLAYIGAILGLAGVCYFIGIPNQRSIPVNIPAPLLIPAEREPESFKQDRALEKEESKRSSKWPAFEKKCVAAHPFCAYCGRTQAQARQLGGSLQAHHIHPFHEMTDAQKGTSAPGGELDPANIIILCECQKDDHHLRIGHAGNFKDNNPHVVEDCKANEAKLRAAGEWPE